MLTQCRSPGACLCVKHLHFDTGDKTAQLQNLRCGLARKRITATAHKLARILYNLMRYGVEYMQKTEADYADQERARQEKSFHRRAKELGYEVRRPPANDEPIPAMS